MSVSQVFSGALSPLPRDHVWWHSEVAEQERQSAHSSRPILSSPLQPCPSNTAEFFPPFYQFLSSEEHAFFRPLLKCEGIHRRKKKRNTHGQVTVVCPNTSIIIKLCLPPSPVFLLRLPKLSAPASVHRELGFILFLLKFSPSRLFDSPRVMIKELLKYSSSELEWISRICGRFPTGWQIVFPAFVHRQAYWLSVVLGSPHCYCYNLKKTGGWSELVFTFVIGKYKLLLKLEAHFQS